jgi:hypothetical protein
VWKITSKINIMEILTRLCSEDIKTATDLERAAFGFGLGGEEY